MRHALAVALLLAFATPALAEGERWTFAARDQATDGHPATLRFGTNEPEDIPFMLSCRPGSGQIHIQAWVDTATPTPRSAAATLTSGPVRASVSVRINGEEMYGGTEVYGAFSARVPVMAAFRRSGRLGVSVAGHAVSPLRSASPAMVARFLASCG